MVGKSDQDLVRLYDDLQMASGTAVENSNKNTGHGCTGVNEKAAKRQIEITF
jgi:hypothetical protein